jgi:hypothetical protein
MLLKWSRELYSLSSTGRSFHKTGAATEKALSPKFTVFDFVLKSRCLD